jgi:ribonuclease HI
MTNLIILQFDGGCSHNPGNKYGSFAVFHQIETRPPRLLEKQLRFQLGYGTNNEAEWEALLTGLQWTRDAINAGCFLPRDFEVKMITDSTVVGFRIAGTNTSNKSEPEKRMFKLHAAALKYLTPFKCYWIDMVNRQKNVELFGH